MLAASDQEYERSYAELGLIPGEHPLAPLARVLAGQTELRRGLVRNAEAYFRDALQIAPYALQAHRELAYICNIQHRQAEMEAHLEALSELQTLSFDHLLLWSKTRSVGWSPKADLATLEKYAAMDKDDRWSRLAIAEGLRRKNKLDAAEALLDEVAPSDPEALALRALIALDRSDAAAAESILKSGPRDNPALARLRGQLALRRRDADAALESYRIAYNADPLDRSSAYGLGMALHMRGDEEESQKYLSLVHKHDAIFAIVAHASTEEGEKDPEVPRRMGVACFEAGRIAEARAWLRLAVKMNPLDYVAQESLYLLTRDHPSRFAHLSRTIPGSPGDASASVAGIPRRLMPGEPDPLAPPR
jgi:tetratricopeptide (TPR) repeat protein